MINQPDSKIIKRTKESLKGEKGPFTLADVSTKAGLSLQDSKDALTYLVAEYRGGLKATSEGELLYQFPTGFTKPWESKEKLQKIWEKVKKFSLGALKFIVRAWICIVMVAYALIFALILIGLTFSKSSDRDNQSSFSSHLMLHLLFRTIFDALFWTFHPFSPFRFSQDPYYDYRVGYRTQKKTPFYEKVNRFFFGPEENKPDSEDIVRLALEEIRSKNGRVGLTDIMRVTGLSKEKADPFIAKLLVNHDGDVKVAHEGGIFYEFSSMRKTAQSISTEPPPPIWSKKVKLLPFTGNPTSSNVLIAGLNGFNLIMSMVAISSSWTLEKFKYLFTVAQSDLPPELLLPPPDGTALVLGWIPFIFSGILFAIPISRYFMRPKKVKEINIKNGRRGLLRGILQALRFKRLVPESELEEEWIKQADAPPPKSKYLTREIIKFGGEIQIDEKDNIPKYEFSDLENEMKAVREARKKATSDEAQIGEVVFSSLK